MLARIRAELDLVDLIARQLSRSLKRVVDFDDLLSAGREGLFLAARNFDPARGVPFRAYANIRIRGAMLDGVRHQALSRRAFERLRDLQLVNDAAEGFAEVRVVASQTGAQAEAGLSEQIADLATAFALTSPGPTDVGADAAFDDGDAPEPENPEQLYARAEEHQRVREAVADLGPPFAQVLRLYYFEGLQLEDIARQLGLERSWVGRLSIRARRDLTHRLRERL